MQSIQQTNIYKEKSIGIVIEYGICILLLASKLTKSRAHTGTNLMDVVVGKVFNFGLHSRNFCEIKTCNIKCMVNRSHNGCFHCPITRKSEGPLPSCLSGINVEFNIA